MDRLNQLRGDAGASRDSTLDTSSLAGEAYLTANDSSKYFSLSEGDSNIASSPSKEVAGFVDVSSTISNAERIISNLSPIPKNNELDTFKIGEQIEAANILSGGVNIFDDNENSYDGDELVIDDAVVEGDDKSVELKLDENTDDIVETFEKTERLSDTNMEVGEAATPTGATGVALQIDGKNVDAIDIGNGLYLYRKEGEEELAAVQILNDHQQKPNTKFLKVRENAEGNLEVYEEIEIEVPKEVPPQEGLAVTESALTVKDYKVSECSNNIVVENKKLTVLKDNDISEVEFDLNKDNTYVESKSEASINGKMIKFSESRKSPVIGSFTPMTYHSTPNKEGIPLTKTMVDLQLHPNRHSENVKKTIEVHTDNCKQKLLETPTKDTNEHSKSSEFILSSLDKDLTNDIHGVELYSQENNKEDKALIVNNTDSEIILNINDDKNMSEETLPSQQTRASVTQKVESNTVKVHKTDSSDINVPSLLTEKPLAALDGYYKESKVNTLTTKTSLNESCSSRTNNNIVKTQFDTDEVQTQISEAKHNEYSKSADVKINEAILKDTIDHEIEIESVNVSIEKDIICNKDKIIDIALKENLSDISLDKKNAAMSQNNAEKKDDSNINKHEQNPTKLTEGSLPNSRNLNTNQEDKLLINKPLDIKSDPNKDIEMVNDIDVRDFDIKPVQLLTNLIGNDQITRNMQSKPTILPDELKLVTSMKPLPKESIKPLHNLINPTESKTSLSLHQAESSTNTLSNLLKEKDLTVQQKDEPKNSLPEEEEKKNKLDTKPVQSELKDINYSLKYPEMHESTEGKITENADKRVGKLSETPVKKNAVELVQPDVVASKPSINDLKLESNTGRNIIQKSLLTTDQKCTRNSIPVTSSITEKNDKQNKNETNLKLPISHKHIKVSLPTTDSKMRHLNQNVRSEIDNGKNDIKKEPAKVIKSSIAKPINNNKTAVPFGKWTEANRQEFLNKIKESKVPPNTSNTKQLKQPNDLNRRDVLQKIDSQRQSTIASAKVQELNTLNKTKLKQETAAFGSKSNAGQKEKVKDNRISPSVSKAVELVSLASVENKTGHSTDQPPAVVPIDMSTTTMNNKKDPIHRKEINNQDLIDKTIEGIINRAVTAKFGQDDAKQNEPVEKSQNASSYTPVSLDEIESKMNELHGIPFVERPPHQLPQINEHETKSIITTDIPAASLGNKIHLVHKPQQKKEEKVTQPGVRINEESDEEIIDHVPLTGDIGLNKINVLVHGQLKEKNQSQELNMSKRNCDSKKDPIITENDFDKFARRNSITYENCLTVNFDGKEHHNVIQTVVEKEAVPKKLSRNEIMLAESKAKSNKQLPMRHMNFPSKIPTMIKAATDEDSYNKNYQSKLQIAYQSVMTKRQQEYPITIIEDKPVKVVFMDGNHEYTPHQLNVQGKELSPPKKSVTEWDHFTHSNSESLDSSESALDAGYDSKSQDEGKFKSKHQRKQVLTPVDTPELELIEPSDLGIDVSPKKKRKVEDNKPEKNSKALVPKKSYLLNRNITSDNTPSHSHDLTKTPLKESINQQDMFIKHSDPISAIDNLVKAAELLETQSENNHILPLSGQISPNQQNTPIKRGRGRPRKYPIPDSGSDSKSPSPVKTPTPQKKPRLIDAKTPKYETESEDDEINSDGELVKENWTMGKINKNIVCPICNKLFRSENVVYKHVKHCTGPSPSRSDSDKTSPRRMRQSQELDWKSEGSKSDGMDIEEDFETSIPTKKRKSKEDRSSMDEKPNPVAEVIVIEDTPSKDKSPVKKREKLKHESNKTTIKTNIQQEISSLMCEFCGKTFRQLSYLVNHKLQHKNTELKKIENDHVHKSIFSCEVCKKEFRKLHHLVQHRSIHSSMRTSRKSSSEHNDKITKDTSKANEDQSAGFRCEPCDKSFRKLHHLVEHRETHDEINKKCNPVTNNVVDTIKPNPLHHCDICKKTFKKLQLLLDHKENHIDTSSEKSDDKSVKSSLSTKDIIHECPLCYMVFPNEHSLNKHHIICQRKKKQSAAKQSKKIEENDVGEVDDDTQAAETDDENLAPVDQKVDVDASCVIIEDETPNIAENQEATPIQTPLEIEHKKEANDNNEVNSTRLDLPLKPEMEEKIEIPEKQNKPTNKKDGNERNFDKISVRSKKHLMPTAGPVEIINIPDTPTPKKKLVAKDKIGPTGSKRQKSSTLPDQSVVKTVDTSDDDEIRYMLNPDFQVDETREGKLFMKVRAKKRNSLQIERPNSKDLMKRRISLQHPPKIPRLKVKPIPRNPKNTNTVAKTTKSTVSVEQLVSSDSDDSDVKYSFPESIMKEMAKQEQKKVKRQTMTEKRKSLSNIAKRKSLGKTMSNKKAVNSPPAKQIKKRTTEVEHRCDCGQLFSSAALLTRHMSLTHTPPRIRRRRSLPPDSEMKPPLKRPEKSQDPKKTIKPNPDPKKSGVATRKSSINSEVKRTPSSRKSANISQPRRSVVKTSRSTPHRGGPVPEKKRKFTEKSKK